MKKIKFLLLVAFALSLGSCLKDTPNVDFSNLQTTVEFYKGGLNFFNEDAVIFTKAVDTANRWMAVNIASAYPLTTPLTVTVAVDTNLVATYKAENPGVDYQVLPAAAYVFPDQTFTIPAGSRVDSLYLTLYNETLDPTVSYMLPIVIKDASGQIISANKGQRYYHMIGNPIAGTYNSLWTRWNSSSDAGTPIAGTPAADVAVFSPVSPTTIGVPSGSGPVYLLSFTNTGGVLTDFTVAFDAASVTAAGITITSGPTIVSADPTTGTYSFKYGYNNSAGSARVIHDDYSK
jgi:Domain of unknown function (DUF1735)